MVRNTSVVALDEIKKKGLLSQKRLEAYEILYQYGPMTAVELYVKASEIIQNGSIRDHYQPRLTEMREMGCVAEVGERECKQTGFNAIVWDVTDQLPKKPVKKVSKKEKKDVLLDKIASIGKEIDPTWKDKLREVYVLARDL